MAEFRTNRVAGRMSGRGSGPGSGASLAWDTLLELARFGGSSRERLVLALRDAISSGRVPAGAALPPSRTLADTLVISRWAVTEAYSQLADEGYLEARTGSGTRVRRQDRSDSARGDTARAATGAGEVMRPRLSLYPGLPDLREFPRQSWQKAMTQALAGASFLELGYHGGGGPEGVRRTVAEYLFRCRDAVVDKADLTMTRGTRDGLGIVARMLREDGVRRVAVEDPSWDAPRDVLAHEGLEVVPVPVDDDGLVVWALAGLDDVGAVLVAPAHQFPLGVRLSEQRRGELVRWARERHAVVLEDDYDAEFRYDGRPLACLQSVAPDVVLLLGTVSKTLAPAVGLGWVVSPPHRTQRLQAARAPGQEPTSLTQLCFARLVENGGYDRHLRASRRRYRARRQHLLRALEKDLPGWQIGGAAAGLHLVVRPPRPACDGSVPGGSVHDGSAVVREARARGLSLLDPRTLHANGDDPGYLVLGYANCRDADIEPAVAALAAVLARAGRAVPSVPGS